MLKHPAAPYCLLYKPLAPGGFYTAPSWLPGKASLWSHSLLADYTVHRSRLSAWDRGWLLYTPKTIYSPRRSAR